MTLSTKRPLRPPRSPTASPLAVSFQAPELDLQVAIRQLFSQRPSNGPSSPACSSDAVTLTGPPPAGAVTT